MATVSSPSVDYIRKDNAYKAAKKEVREKIDRCRDVDTGEFSEDLFRSLYPDYGEPSDYLAKRKGEVRELKAVADRAKDVHVSIVDFDDMDDEDQKAANSTSAIRGTRDTLGGELMKSAGWRGFKNRETPVLHHTSDMEFKALFQTTDGYAPESTRSGVHVELPQRRLGLVDIVPSETTTMDTYKFMHETTNTAPTNMNISEGDVYPESTFVWEQVDQPIVQIGTHVQVTDIVLEDEPSARARIDRGIVGQVRRRVEEQMWDGSGASNVIRGFSNVTDVQTLDATSMNFYEAITNAQDEVWKDGEAEANYAVVNSSDWTKWIQSQESTGAFIVNAGDTTSQPARMVVDIPIIRSNVVPAGSALVGDFNYSLLVDRRSISLNMQEAQNAPSTGGATQPMGRFNIYGAVRVALAVLRPPAYCLISNISFS